MDSLRISDPIAVVRRGMTTVSYEGEAVVTVWYYSRDHFLLAHCV